MNAFQFLPVKLALCVLLGILLGYYLDPTPIVSLVIAGTSVLTLGLIYKLKKNQNTFYYGAIFLLAAISIGVFSFSLTQPKNKANHYQQYDTGEKTIWHVKVLEVLKSTEFSHRYIVRIRAVGENLTSGNVVVNTPKDSINFPLFVDQEFSFYGNSTPIGAPKNPYQFNYKNYMKVLGVTHQINIDDLSTTVFSKSRRTIYGMAASLRNTISKDLKKAGITPEAHQIMEALLLGQRNDISPVIYDNYKKAGAVHILAVSGLHIGILLLLLQFLLKPLHFLPHGKVIKLILIVCTLWGFAILAGLSASIVRAVTMFSFLAYASFLNRPTNTYNILALSLLAIVLVEPRMVFQVGFQMSYIAVFAIVWIYPLLQNVWKPKNWFVQKTWQILSVSIAAQLGVLPISLYYFHQFPSLFFVSNLIIIPFLGLLLGLGIAVIGLALVQSLPPFLASGYSFLIACMNTVIAWVAKQETFVFSDISFDGIQLVLWYFILIFILQLAQKLKPQTILLLFLGIIGLQSYALLNTHRGQQKNTLWIGHKTRNTVLLHHRKKQLTVMTTDSLETVSMVRNYAVGERLTHIYYKPLKNSYEVNTTPLTVLDSTGLYSLKTKPHGIILLTESPEIHLERLITDIQPKVIVADGSNYRSLVRLWKASCKKQKIPFHYTGEKGAFRYEAVITN